MLTLHPVSPAFKLHQHTLFLPQELSTQNQESDILADFFPLSGAADDVASHAGFSAPTNQSTPPVATYSQTVQPCIYGQPSQPNANPYGQPAQPSANPYYDPGEPSSDVYGQSVQPSVNPYSQPAQPHPNLYSQPPQPNANPYGQPTLPNADPYGQPAQPNANSYSPVSSHMAAQPQSPAGPADQFNSGKFLPQPGSVMPVASQSAHQTTNAAGAQNNNDALRGLFSEPSKTSMVPQTVTPLSTGALAIVPQPSWDKFEPKSAVWSDTLSRGLVNLNISGPKTNPLADIGIDFDAINRKEKRMQKPASTAVTSTVTMGKAMGSGSGIGCAGASALRPPSNPMVGSGIGIGMQMGGGPVGGMGMGGYGGMNQQPMGMGMGMGMNNMGMNPGMGMSMGMGQRTYMQPQTGMPGSYNPMMGSGGYSQPPLNPELKL